MYKRRLEQKRRDNESDCTWFVRQVAHCLARGGSLKVTGERSLGPSSGEWIAPMWLRVSCLEEHRRRINRSQNLAPMLSSSPLVTPHRVRSRTRRGARSMLFREDKSRRVRVCEREEIYI